MSSIKQRLKKRPVSLELGEYVDQSLVHFRPSAVPLLRASNGGVSCWTIVLRIKMWSKPK